MNELRSHPVDLLEPEVSSMFRRTMKKADAMGRLMEPGEEINLTHMSVATSLKRMADSFDKMAFWLIVIAFVAPTLFIATLAILAFAVSKLT